MFTYYKSLTKRKTNQHGNPEIAGIRAGSGVYQIETTEKKQQKRSPFLKNSDILIHSKPGWTATTRHRVTRNRSAKRLKHIGNLFRKNLHDI